MTWGNSRCARLLAWVFRYSPSVYLATGKPPTFKQAWTGLIKPEESWLNVKSR